jgi:hypothetical protein
LVKTSYPEIASYSQAELGRTEVRSDGSVHLRLTIRGSNGHSVAAHYQMVWEGGVWKVQGVVTGAAPA